MTNFEVIKSCRLCKSDRLNPIMDFGETALANSYLDKPEKHEAKYPLSLVRCWDCGHVQLKETILPDLLFSNYLYSTSDSPPLVKHFKEYAASVISDFKLNEHSQIMEIGCNDGLLLKELRSAGIIGDLIGIDPASNITDRARQDSTLSIYTDFFNSNLAQEIVSKHGKSELIIANNVFAHIDCLDSITQGIKNALSEEGVFVFENAYLPDTIDGLYFDQVYHEHLQYYSIQPLKLYFDKFGLRIFRVRFNKNQGGSFRCFVTHKDNAKYPTESSVDEAIRNEYYRGMYSQERFVEFKKDLFDLQYVFKRFMERAKLENKTISCYGCPAKFALFSKFFGLDFKNVIYVVDDAKIKQGKLSPQGQIPIVNREYFLSNPTDYCIISVWNMSETIISKNQEYKGKFVVPMPHFRVT